MKSIDLLVNQDYPGLLMTNKITTNSEVCLYFIIIFFFTADILFTLIEILPSRPIWYVRLIPDHISAIPIINVHISLAILMS